MIPIFPQFKKVDVNDRADIEAFTHRFPPYSDFNFTSLWAWDTSEERKISVLNDNLVVRFTDYSTHDSFLSFLGTQESKHTAQELIDYASSEGMVAELRLVPEVSIKAIRPSVLEMQEDRDNFDYVLSLSKLAHMTGSEIQKKRNVIKNFRARYPQAILETADLQNHTLHDHIRNTIDTWETNKIKNNKLYELEHEHLAISRLLSRLDSPDIAVFGVFIESRMVAFSIDELLPDQYAIMHFWKADTEHRGIYEFIQQAKALHLETQDKQFLNFEQDLCIPSMKTSKMAYRPILFLRKYTVHLPI